MAARLPELLAPAGDWECARAAVENGADAIYFGLDRFNARMRARNFTEADLPALMTFLHRRGVRGYVSFNTLVFTDELPEAEEFLRACIAAGVDAAIVQDIGLCRLIRRLSSDFPIHASTQMTLTSLAGVTFAGELGCEVVVLARECTLGDIARIQEGRSAGPVPDPIPRIEVFVHGALCIAYSGQCLTSEALGGRSANRGECAQACRLPYRLLADGQPVPLGDRRYLLSPQDLAGLELLPELHRLGVRSLKIEGRLKSAEYVANITRLYRHALDQMATETETTSAVRPRADPRGRTPPPTVADRYAMDMAFSRGLCTGWLKGIDNRKLVHARFGKKRGVFLGVVRNVAADHVRLRLQGPLRPGDGVVFDAGRPDQPEQGGRVYSVEQHGDEAVLGFGRDDLDLRRIRPGDRLWKTSDPELERELRGTYSGDRPHFRRPVAMDIHGRAGEPLVLEVRDDEGHLVRTASEQRLQAAERQPLSSSLLEKQLGRLGDTPFRLGRLDNHLDGAVILPVSVLNRMRRAATRELEALRAQPPCWHLLAPRTQPAPIHSQHLPDATAPHEPVPPANSQLSTPQAPPRLAVLARSLDQLDTLLECGVDALYCEFEDPKRYREAVQRVRARRGAGRDRAHPDLPPAPLFVAPPRITKPGEEWILSQVRSSGADGYLIRNYDHLDYFQDCRRVGDYSLNVANPLTVQYLERRFRLERLTASYDLNLDQLAALLRATDPASIEVTVHQHMPMFHMEHCLFCAFLTERAGFTDCGRPCDRRQVEIEDRVGTRHPVRADAGCRNTVFSGLAQTAAEYVPRLLTLGVRWFRVELLEESPTATRRTVGLYQALLHGEIRGDAVWRELKLEHQLGVTRGPMDRGRRPVTLL